MKVAVLQFPGSNCDQDALYSLRQDIGVGAEYVWYEETSLAGFGAVFIPGGFSFGDYLRCGAMASRAPIMDSVRAMAGEGKPVIGVCNGFQILCEAGLLPGALLLNESQRFVCKVVHLRAENRSSMWTRGVDRILEVPVAHGEGRYICGPEELEVVMANERIAFRYVDADGNIADDSNPNGSTDNIAGVLNEKGNVLGMMPHPERATNERLGSADGSLILKALTLVEAGL